MYSWRSPENIGGALKRWLEVPLILIREIFICKRIWWLRLQTAAVFIDSGAGSKIGLTQLPLAHCVSR